MTRILLDVYTFAKACEQKTSTTDLDVDLPHALERPPVERVLVEQLAGTGRLHVPGPEVDAVARLLRLERQLADDTFVLSEEQIAPLERLWRVSRP